MQVFTLSFESMASRSLLHDIGVQRPKVIQCAAWQAAPDESRTGSSLQRLWLSPDFVDPAAQFGLLAASSTAQPGKDWETVRASLSESRYNTALLTFCTSRLLWQLMRWLARTCMGSCLMEGSRTPVAGPCLPFGSDKLCTHYLESNQTR